VTDIKPPDFETRMAILRKRVEEDGLQISGLDDVLTLIARSRSSSVREIEGAVIKLLAYSSLTGRQIDLALAQEALGGPAAADGRHGGAMDAGATPDRVRSGGARLQHHAGRAAVQEAHQGPHGAAAGGDVLIKELFDVSLVEIGRMFGGRDHSTVIHSIAKGRRTWEPTPPSPAGGGAARLGSADERRP
jgi:chromosomal replication initiator protein